VNGTNSGARTTSDPLPSVHTTPTPKASPILSSPKKTVQVNGDDSSDDDVDYSPPVRRKGFTKFSSPRHAPKALVTSPKKVGNRVKRLNRKEELEEERMKLPIWTGMRSIGPFLQIAREPLLKMIEENQVTILLGETGCGKSTRMLLICYSDKRTPSILASRISK
jgi:HrpA-like RNA helicase